VRERLSQLRSVAGLLGALTLWVPFTFLMYLWTLPASRIWPEKRLALVSSFMKRICVGIFFFVRLGGARLRRTGRIPTEGATLVVMNHQALFDIVTVTLMASPYVPAFVTRKRYARFIPLVSACIRLLGCPVVDPKHNRIGSVAAVKKAAARLEHGLLVFPEGHRTRDGEIRPFRPAGLTAILEARRLTTYVVVSDGFWLGRRFVDSLFNVNKIRGRTEVMGPFESPADADQIPAFVEGLREKMVERLAEMRERGPHGA